MSVTFSAANANAPETHTFSDGQTQTFPGRVDLGDDWYFNLCNTNARALLRLLGLDGSDDGLCGSHPIPELRRAIIRAKATGAAANHTREDEVIYGQPRTNDDGTVELRPLRSYSYGLDIDGLVSRLDNFAELVEFAATKGATHITWG